MTIAEEIKDSFKHGSVLTRLIYINIAVFLVIRIIYVVFYLTGNEFNLQHYLSLPADIDQLLRAPWTLFTYMFLHWDFLHILFNVLWLYWLGRIFLMYFNENQLLGVYLLGGLTGGAFFVLTYNMFPAFSNVIVFSRLLGASASVIAIIMAIATYVPNHTINLLFIGPVKMKHLALFSIILYIIGIASSNAGGNLAHIGGAAFGFVFAKVYRNQHADITCWLTNIFASIKSLFNFRRPPVKVTYRSERNEHIEYNRGKNIKQDEINRVLDKISKSGYDSLTKQEKELLFKMGK